MQRIQRCDVLFVACFSPVLPVNHASNKGPAAPYKGEPHRAPSRRHFIAVAPVQRNHDTYSAEREKYLPV